MDFFLERNLNAEDMNDLVGAFRIEKFKKDEAVVEVGTLGFKFYIIM